MDPQSPPQKTLSVTQLNRDVKRLLGSHFGFVWVEAEVSNLAQPGSGHWHFTLKDDSSQVRCAMFRNRNQRLRIQPSNGQMVRVRASVSLYEARGDYQLIVEHMEPAGAGAMQLAFEQLKQALNQEGLFAAERKLPLPDFPQHIGIITSPTGAAIRDILTVFRRRFPGLELSVLPVPVQGEEAPPAIVEAIEQANRWQHSGQMHFDTLLVSRGGGSIEDLWAFNNEAVARAIADSNIPVVSAVGHEIDFTIADFVADARAPTPSAAAEMLSPDTMALERQLTGMLGLLQRCLQQQLQSFYDRISALRRTLRHPGERLQEQSQYLDHLDIRLRRAMDTQLQGEQLRLQRKLSRFMPHSPLRRVQQLRQTIDSLKQRLQHGQAQYLQLQHRRLDKATSLLNTLGPQSTLDRGYAIVTDSAGEVLRNTDQMKPGVELTTRLANGRFNSTVTELD